MSSFEHHATVDKGLKMKIKRKNVSADKSDKMKKDQNKTDLLNKSETKIQGENSQSANGMLTDKTGKLSLFSDKEKSPKSKSALGKKDKGKGLAKSDSAVSGSTSSLTSVEGLFGQSSAMEPKLGETATGKKECVPDPYEFNAKVEDGISMPMKKIKLEKEKQMDTPTSLSSASTSSSLSSHDASTDTHDVAVLTDPDCLGPCEPGTQVTLEGIVWHESENGVLVVNVTWRGKTYVGTLLDATRHDWAPPRFNCDSPSMELESRTPKGRGKRRGAANTPVNNDTRTLRKGRRGSSAQTFTAPPSPAKSDVSTGGVKRKGRPQDIDLSVAEQRCSKRSRSGSQAPTPNIETPPTDAQGFYECPEPGCNKKYRNINGLKYHQSHAHSGSNSNLSADDAKEDMDTEDVPLSVVKNSVRKEKEANKKETNSSKKEGNNKDNVQANEKNKSEKNESVTKVSDKEESNDSKDTGSKTDAKCDSGNANSSKKKDNNTNKVPVSQSGSKNSGNQSSLPKSSSTVNISSQVTVSSQVVSNSVQTTPSQITTLSSTSPSSSASLVTSTSSSTVQAITQGEKTDSKHVDIKAKIVPDTRVTKPNRPIVPAPSHPVLSSVQVTHSNLSPVMSHTQMSPQLKPIQPKPTIMGEPQNINPVLADLNKDRKKAQKKKNKDGVQNGNSLVKPDQPTIKIERTGVIKTNPNPNNRQQVDQHKRDVSSVKDSARSGPGDTQRSQALGPHQHKGVDLSHSRGSQNPNLLKVSSPLQVNTPDNHNKVGVNDDVQSPAYSDISDANESASPAAPSDTSPQKQKEDVNTNKKEEKSEATPPQPSEGQGQMMSHYGMYSYYAQSPYGMNNMSPGQKSTGSNSAASTPSSQPNQDANKSTPSNEKPKVVDEQVKADKKIEEKEPNRPKPTGQPTLAGPPPSNMSPQQMQMMYQMYMQSLPQHIQYQYMANGWYPPMDSNFVRQMMEEQQRRAQAGEPGRNDREGGQVPDRAPSRGPDREMKGQPNMGPTGVRKDDNSGLKSLNSPVQGKVMDRNDQSVKNDEKNSSVKDQALREKKNETHQILKENIDLKNEMDKNRQEHERMRKEEEMRRYQMYQEQKMIEERKKMDLVRKSGENRPENLTSKAPGTKPIIEHSPRNMTTGQRSNMEIPRDKSAKRDNNNMDPKLKDPRENHPRDLSASGKYPDPGKPGEEKARTPVSDKHRSETPNRNPDTPKQRPGGSSSKSGSPLTSVNSSVPGSPSFNPYVNSYPYMQNPHYMAMDQTHPMYRSHSVNPALIGSYPPGYIHSSQIGYRPMADEEKEKLSAQKSGPPVSDSDLKKGDASSHGPYFSNVHKIHELSEKNQSKSRNSSPGPIKQTDNTSGSFDKHRDYTNSPPTQRHVHTHHHTHVLQPAPGIQPGAPLQAPPGFSPVYDPYSAMFVSQAQSPHPFPPK